MSTLAGVVAVNRRVIGAARGESPPIETEGEPPHANRLGCTAADHHLRELCVSCHLGQPNEQWGPIGEESRGGGCNACHLVYGERAAGELARCLTAKAEKRRSIPRLHPALTVNPGNEHCFGCHSRSSRISTSYEGWHELRGDPPAGMDPARLRKLDDGRYFERATPDVHYEPGLECIDCHTSNELMGSGALVARKTDQLRVGCGDCHAAKLASIDPAALDPESRTLLALRKWTLAPSQRLGATRDGEPLVNVVVDENGRGRLRRKRTGEWLRSKRRSRFAPKGGDMRGFRASVATQPGRRVARPATPASTRAKRATTTSTRGGCGAPGTNRPGRSRSRPRRSASESIATPAAASTAWSKPACRG